MYEPRPVLLHAMLAFSVRLSRASDRRAHLAAPRIPGAPAAAARDEVQPVGEDRRRRGDLRAAAKPPQLTAGLRIVAAHEWTRW